VIVALLIATILSMAVHVRAFQPAADSRDARILRVEQWLKATLHHTPGASDEATAVVGGWSPEDLRTLWSDAAVVVALMNRRGPSGFGADTDSGDDKHGGYTRGQLQRLQALACAAAGRATWTNTLPNLVTDPTCVVARIELDRELRELSAQAEASTRRGDPNFVLRRAALLHADVAIGPIAARKRVDLVHDQKTTGGAQQIRLNVFDGREIGLQQVPVHWTIGRMLLDHVRPAGSNTPAPGRDEMVRQWYRASAAWMQNHEDHDTTHLNHARALFPNDPDILFLSACQREAFAAPRIQSATRTAAVPAGFALDVALAGDELRQAKSLFQRVVDIRPDAVEAHLRLGHVLLRLGQFQKAVGELRQAVADLETDDQLRYDGELFLGASEESLGHADAAREAYAAAAALFPTAQSPHIALSALARRRGDRATALREIQFVFELQASPLSHDPWWNYHTAQARNADELLTALRQPFLAEAVR